MYSLWSIINLQKGCQQYARTNIKVPIGAFRGVETEYLEISLLILLVSLVLNHFSKESGDLFVGPQHEPLVKLVLLKNTFSIN